MLKSALQSIKDDPSRSLFYWLTFVLTSMFIFLFFNISYSDMVGVTFINSRNDMSTLTTILVIAICMIVIFFANDFYVKKKSKQIAVRLVCGATFLQITKYLLYQTFLLFVLAVPVGLGLALLTVPLINYILIDILNSISLLKIQWDAIVSTVIIIGFEIFWCTLLNVGYAYRSSIKTLMDDEKVLTQFVLPFPWHIGDKMKKWGSLILFVGPIVVFYFYGDEKSMLFLSVIGMIGLYGCLNYVVIPWLNHMIQIKYVDHPIRVIYLGFLRHDILMLKKNIVLLIVSAVLLLSIMISSLDHSMEMMLSMVSFVVINVLLSLAVLFKFSSEVVGRKKTYHSLQRVGYMDDMQKDILLKEVVSLYCFILGVSLFYIFNIFMVLCIYHILSMYLMIGMLIAFVFPLTVCGILSFVYYYRVIFKEE